VASPAVETARLRTTGIETAAQAPALRNEAQQRGEDSPRQRERKLQDERPIATVAPKLALSAVCVSRYGTDSARRPVEVGAWSRPAGRGEPERGAGRPVLAAHAAGRA